MGRMGETQELIESPLSTDELAVRYRAMSEDPCFANVPGKLELDNWGRILMTPPSFYHGVIAGRLVRRLAAALGGEAVTDATIATPSGVFLPDVAWASPQFMSQHGSQFAVTRAPEICVEVVSPSNSVRELNEKRDVYLAAGAQEVWIVYPQSKRVEFYGVHGQLPRSNYVVDLSDIFN
jgi:Uma2 family endonuclease